MARPAITYKETFKCPECGLTRELYVPNGTIWHPCRVKGKLKMVLLNSVSIWRKEENEPEDRKVYKQGTLNL